MPVKSVEADEEAVQEKIAVLDYIGSQAPDEVKQALMIAKKKQEVYCSEADI